MRQGREQAKRCEMDKLMIVQMTMTMTTTADKVERLLVLECLKGTMAVKLRYLQNTEYDIQYACTGVL